MIIPFKLTATNSIGHSMILTGQTPEFLVEYSGFDSPVMDMQTIDLYNTDGALYQGSKAQPRSIILNAYILGHVTFWRTEFYRTFVAGRPVTLRYEKDGTILNITGVVDKITTPQFERPSKGKETIQISIVCHQPWFETDERNMVRNSYTSSSGTDTLSFDIQYFGDADVGILLRLGFPSGLASFKNPTVQLTDGNGQTNQIVISGDFYGYDNIWIDTVNHKVYGYLNGAEQNLLTLWQRDNKWLKLTPGDNTVTVSTLRDSGNFVVRLYYKERYQGV